MTNVDPYKEEPFTYAPSDLSKRNYVNQTKTGAVHINYEERDISKARNQSISIGKQMLPLINTTLIDQILQSTIKQENEFTLVQDMMQLKGAYPRWIGSVNMTRKIPETGELKSIVTVVNIGDQDRELKLNIAQGFPQLPLADDEIFIPESFHEYFEFNQTVK